MIMMMVVGMMMMAVIVRWCPLLSVDPCIGRHTPYKTLSQKDDDVKSAIFLFLSKTNTFGEHLVAFVTFSPSDEKT